MPHGNGRVPAQRNKHTRQKKAATSQQPRRRFLAYLIPRHTQTIQTHNNMKKIIFILALAASMASCASSTNASKHQNHLKSSPQHNFKHNDNGGCNWHN